MSRQRTVKLDKISNKNENSNDDQDSTNPACLTTKLERRRRIEDLNEEKRLREELSAF